MDRGSHWDNVFSRRQPTELSWYQPQLRISLELISSLQLPYDSNIIDVGGGDSTLVDDLLGRGYTSVAVLDISPVALERAKKRLGQRATRVKWIIGDVTQVNLAEGKYDLWHDRALFHFLIESEERQQYIKTMQRALRKGGYWVVATFAPEGPEVCSGLPTMRYSPKALGELVGTDYKLIESRKELHKKPQGGAQEFVYCVFQKRKIRVSRNT